MFVPMILSVCIISVTVQPENTLLEDGGNPDTTFWSENNHDRKWQTVIFTKLNC